MNKNCHHTPLSRWLSGPLKGIFHTHSGLIPCLPAGKASGNLRVALGKLKPKAILSATICLLSINTFFAQSFEHTLHFANEKMQQEEYELAIEALNRAFFFNSSDELTAQIAFDLGLSYQATGDLHNAKKFYDIAYRNEFDEHLKNEIIFKKVFVHYQLQEYQFALVELFSLPEQLNESQIRTSNFYLGLISYQLNKFDESKEYFRKCFDEENNQNQVDSLLQIVEKMHPNWPRISQFMSVFIPGSGQLANGEFQSGINSLVLTSGIFVLYLYTIPKI
jgi:tetratricopeptide (TPR) repeat protein